MSTSNSNAVVVHYDCDSVKYGRVSDTIPFELKNVSVRPSDVEEERYIPPGAMFAIGGSDYTMTSKSTNGIPKKHQAQSWTLDDMVCSYQTDILYMFGIQSETCTCLV